MHQVFNAASYLLDRRLEAGDGDRVAVTGPRGTLTYQQLYDLTGRIAGGLAELGVRPEQRVVLFTADSPNMMATILAAMRIGAVPVPVSTMLTPQDLAGVVHDSRAALVVVSPEFAAAAPDSAPVVVEGTPEWDRLLSAGSVVDLYDTWEDTVGLWLYTSGTTGIPKAAMHRHAAIRVVCETYGRQVLGIRAGDRVLSVPKMFFAYGLGTSMFFPLSVGASVVLEPARSTPATVTERLREDRPTIFVAGPTFFAAMLNTPVPEEALAGVRLATSAGEPLPAPIYQRFLDRYGVQIIDGLGSTEALHIFISNRPGDVTPGTSGTPVPGYRVRLVDDAGEDVPSGVEGHLLASGDSVAVGYWCRYETTRRVFQGEWLRTGDFYVCSPEGTYTYLGRSDDMIKSSGMWVSPAEVEARLLQHPDVALAAVVAVPNEAGLDKIVACVVRRPDTAATAEELIAFCRDGIAHFKCPRTVLFVDELPLTATGKLRRNVIRGQAAELLTEAAHAG
ncbi:MAG TPA: benzoate-CoA ligase family protein [Candidatus Limnocylindrales bacterium]